MIWKYFILNSQGAHSEVKEFQLVETQHRRDDNPMKYATISSRMRYKTRFSIYTVDSWWFQCNACFSVCLQCLFRRQLIFFSMVIFMLMLRLSFNAPDSSISPTVAGCSRISNQHFQQQLYWSILCIRITGRTWCGVSQCPSSLLMRESVSDTLASPDQWSSLVPWLTLPERDYSETSLSSSLLLVSIKIISECFWSWNNILILKSWS